MVNQKGHISTYKVLVVLLLAAAVASVIILKKRQTRTKQNELDVEKPAIVSSMIQEGESSRDGLTSEAADSAKSPPGNLPRLIDFGADKCIPCKMMKPILDEFAADYVDFFRTEFIDVWENPEVGDSYQIRMIPTQIFFNSEGQELFRHEGFYDREAILQKWRELGLNFQKSDPSE